MGRDLDSGRWKKVRQQILIRDNHTCKYCGGVATTVDHIIPRSALPPGHHLTFDPNNLVAACTPCNSRKNNRVTWSNPDKKQPQRKQW